MLLKYNFISPELFHQNIKHDGLVLHPVLEKYILDNISKLQEGTIIFTNTFDIITSNNDSNKRIPIYYNSKRTKYQHTIFKSPYSFEQNNINLSSKIRDCVINQIVLSNTCCMNNKSLKRILLGIGGEYYVYHVIFKKFGYSRMLGFTNNDYIHKDAEYNYSYHKMSDYATSYYLESYLNFIMESDNDKHNLDKIIDELTQKNICIDIIINLSKLNVNVLQFIVRLKKNINSVTIISCHEKDFNTKSQLLPLKFTTNMKSYAFVDETMNQKVSVYHTKFSYF